MDPNAVSKWTLFDIEAKNSNQDNYQDIINEIESIKPDKLSPIEALNKIYLIKELIEKLK